MPTTGSPAPTRALAVPPVDTSCHPLAARAVAKGTNPALFETLKRARIGVVDNTWLMRLELPVDVGRAGVSHETARCGLSFVPCRARGRSDGGQCGGFRRVSRKAGK